MTAKTIGFKKAIQIIEDEQQKKLADIEEKTKANIEYVEALLSMIIQFQSNIIFQLDQLIKMVNNWIQNIQLNGQFEKYKYSFFEELDKLIKDPKSLSTNPIINNISKINQSQKSLLNQELQWFREFKEYSLSILSNIQIDQNFDCVKLQTEQKKF